MKTRSLPAVFLALLALSASAALAEDVAKKWRISLGVGGFNPVGELKSDAANVLRLVDPFLQTARVFEDPRNDSAAFGNLDIQNAPIATVYVQYAVNKIFIVEGSVGYEEGDVGDVEVSAQFAFDEPPIPEIPFNFRTFRVDAGTLTRVPIQLTAMARLRPRAKFNPYFGVGIGYSVIGYDPSDAFNELSTNMDRSLGEQLRLTPSQIGSSLSDPQLASFGEVAEDLSGATVDARDTFEWHLATGMELALRSKWSLFVDLRWIEASKQLAISFNGSEELGFGVPQFTDFFTGIDPLFGGVQIGVGGLIDGGEQVMLPIETAPPDTDCDLQPELCFLEFVPKDEYDTFPKLPEDFVPNGEPDPGVYYVKGGKVSYDGFSAQFGFRYTF